MNNERDPKKLNKYIILFSTPKYAPVTMLHGGDICAPLHRGYEWWMINDSPSADPNLYITSRGCSCY